MTILTRGSLALLAAALPASAMAQPRQPLELLVISPARAEYPAEGRLATKLDIKIKVRPGKDGKITDCRLESANGPAVYAERSCALIRRISEPMVRALSQRTTIIVSWFPDLLVNPQGASPVMTDDDGASYINYPGQLTPDHYPKQALREEQEGTALYRLSLDDQGVPLDCTILESSNVPLLDETTCRVTRSNFRFIPPLDAQGKPRPSSPSRRLVWNLPH